MDQKLYLDPKTNEVYADPSAGLVEIDALICPAIQELNRKGYITSACCSGHANDLAWIDAVHAYIQFDFGEITPEILPGGWHWYDHGQSMEYIYSCQDPGDFDQEAIYVMGRLYDWANHLPNTRA